MGSKFVRSEVTALVRRNTRAYHSLMAEEMGVSLLEYERLVRRHLRNLYRAADVCIRLTPAALESVVESGRYTNSAIRQELEHPFFEDLPSYGYVSTGNERARGVRERGAIEFYGRAKIVLRRALRSRTTVTLSDSEH